MDAHPLLGSFLLPVAFSVATAQSPPANLPGLADCGETRPLGNGDGAFQPAVNFPGGAAPIAVAAGKFDRTGMPDLAVANSLFDNSSTAILLNRLTQAALAAQ